MAARVSCATPVLGPVGGLLGVGLASALAGQASLLCRESLHGGGRGGTPGPAAARPARRGWSAETLLVDAALGIALFKLMGGRFRSVMPSDLSRVGAIALESMPTRGIEYASRGKRRELFRFFKRHAVGGLILGSRRRLGWDGAFARGTLSLAGQAMCRCRRADVCGGAIRWLADPGPVPPAVGIQRSL